MINTNKYTTSQLAKLEIEAMTQACLLNVFLSLENESPDLFGDKGSVRSIDAMLSLQDIKQVLQSKDVQVDANSDVQLSIAKDILKLGIKSLH